MSYLGNVQPLSETGAEAIALSAGYPANPNEAGVDMIPFSGVYVVYQNHRYLLVVRNGRYLTTDISAYDEDGHVLTSEADIWIDFVTDAAAGAAADIISGLEKGFEWAGNVLIDTGKAAAGAAGGLADIGKYLPWILAGALLLVAWPLGKEAARRL